MDTSPRLSAMGLPTLRVSSRASSSAWASTCSAKRRSSRVRSAGATSRQAGKARAARADRGVGLLLPLAVPPRPRGARSPGSRHGPCRPVGAAGRGRPAVTPIASSNAPNRRTSASSSGCHCTPTTKRADGSSTASTSPSAARAVTTSPSPKRSMAWWCEQRHGGRLTQDLRHQRARLGGDLDVGEAAPGRLMAVVTHDVGHVLVRGCPRGTR